MIQSSQDEENQNKNLKFLYFTFVHKVMVLFLPAPFAGSSEPDFSVYKTKFTMVLSNMLDSIPRIVNAHLIPT